MLGREKVLIKNDLAKKILDFKDSKENPKSMVNLGVLGGVVELGQITRIVPDEEVDINSIEDSYGLQSRAEREYSEYLGRIKNMDASGRAKNMVDTMVFLKWKIKGNKKNKISKEVKDKIMFKLIKYFEDNPTEYWAPEREYSYLIPLMEPGVKSTIKGVKSFGQII